MAATTWFARQSFTRSSTAPIVAYICTARGSDGGTYTVSVRSATAAEAFRREQEGYGHTVEIKAVQ